MNQIPQARPWKGYPLGAIPASAVQDGCASTVSGNRYIIVNGQWYNVHPPVMSYYDRTEDGVQEITFEECHYPIRSIVTEHDSDWDLLQQNTPKETTPTTTYYLTMGKAHDTNYYQYRYRNPDAEIGTVAEVTILWPSDHDAPPNTLTLEHTS